MTRWHPQVDRLLTFLDERAAVVFGHPGELPTEPVPGIPTFTAGFCLDTTLTAISLILSGALERYHRIRWILARRVRSLHLPPDPVDHALRGAKLKLAGTALRQDQAVANRMKVFQASTTTPALSSTSAALPSLLDVADPTRMLFGSDFPFAAALAMKYMRTEYEAMRLPATHPARRHRPRQRRGSGPPTQGAPVRTPCARHWPTSCSWPTRAVSPSPR